MDPSRKTAAIAGALYLVTFVSSIPAVGLLDPVINHSGYVLSRGSDVRVIAGCLLDVVNALACIGTAVVLFPVVRRVHEAIALGFVAARLMEAAVIMIGVVSLLAVVTLRREAGGPGGDVTVEGIVRALVAVRNWTFLLGPSLVPAFNAALLGTLLHRSRLVPRIIPTMGLVGAPLLLASTVLTALRGNHPVTAVAVIATLPIFFWELTLGLWLAAKGFTRRATE